MRRKRPREQPERGPPHRKQRAEGKQMRLGEVEEVVKAARDGTLVLLVGAGASAAEKAYLPTFTETLKRLEEWRGYKNAKKTTSNCGRQVDIMEAKHSGTKKRIVELVREAQKRAAGQSRVHAEIAEMWGNHQTDLILTTNWDTLIEDTIGARSVVGISEWRERCAEGGRRAEGMCHLHGSIDGTEQVVSAADMEEHYNKKDEREFLLEIVLHRPILAIGYSMEDEMVRAICEEAKKAARAKELRLWVFAEDAGGTDHEKRAQAERMGEIGAQLIRYPQRRYDEVPVQLEELRKAAMASATHRMEELRYMGRQGPRSVTNWAKMTDVLRTNEPETRALLEEAKQEDWCEDSNFREAIRTVFEVGVLSDSENRVVHWMVQGLEKDHLARIWRMSAETTGRLNPRLRHALALWSELDGQEREIGTTHLVLETVLQSCSQDGFWETDLTGLLKLTDRLVQAGRTWVVWRVFAELTRVTGAPARQFSLYDGDEGKETGQLKPRIEANSYWTYEYWKRHGKSHVAEYTEEVLTIVTGELQRYEAIRKGLGGEDVAWDAWSYGRSGIEENDQDGDKHHRPENALIEAGRDAIEALGRKGKKTRWQWWIEQLESRGGLLGRRLATHGMATATVARADEKLRWITDKSRMKRNRATSRDVPTDKGELGRRKTKHARGSSRGDHEDGRRERQREVEQTATLQPPSVAQRERPTNRPS